MKVKFYDLMAVRMSLKLMATERTTHTIRKRKMNVALLMLTRMSYPKLSDGTHEPIMAAMRVIENALEFQYHKDVKAACWLAHDLVGVAMDEARGFKTPFDQQGEPVANDFAAPSEDMEDIPF